MSDNQNLPFTLPGHRVLALEGPDAARFAHAQFMSDVAGLADGQWQWSGWLTPKGRVTALFALLRFDAQRLWLLLPDADPEALAERLRRFVFRSKVALLARKDLAATGQFSGAQAAIGADAHRATIDAREPGSATLDFGGDGGGRTLAIGPAGPATVVPDPGAPAAWRAFDLIHGLPRLPAGQAEHWTPQQLSLERLRAYSVKKGCYPGQEIVARTHFLGQAKRELVLLEGDAGFAAVAEVRIGGQPGGSVVCVEGTHALAVLPLDRDATAALDVDGLAARERPLQSGLAR